MTSYLYLGGLLVLLMLTLAAAALYWRFYREDEHNDARRVAKNSGVSIAANLVSRVIDFALFVVITRFLGTAGVGALAFPTLLVGLYLTTVVNWGLNDLTVREAAVQPARAGELYSLALRLRLLLAGAAVPVAALVALVVGLGPNPLSPAALGALALLVFTLFPAALAAACDASFRAAQRMEVPALVVLLTNIARGLSATLVLFGGGGVVALAAVSLATTALNGLLLWALQRRLLFHAPAYWNWREARGMLREAFPLLLNSLLLGIFFRFDVVVIQWFLGEADLGAYDAAYKPINMLTIVPGYFMLALFPIMARQAAEDRAALRRTFDRAVLTLALLAWPVAAAISVLAEPIMLLVTTPEFVQAGAARALAVLIWFMPFSYANGVAQYVLIAIRRQAAITRVFALATAFNLVANVVLVPRLGIQAAALTTVVTELVIMVPFVAILRREGLEAPLLWPRWRPILAAAAMAGAILAGAPVHWLLGAALAPPVYLATLWAVGGIGPEERRLMRRVLGRY